MVEDCSGFLTAGRRRIGNARRFAVCFASAAFFFVASASAAVAVSSGPQTGGAEVSTSSPPIVMEMKDIGNNAFSPGEKLTFAIRYEFITAGQAIMEVREGPVINGRPTLELATTARSNKFIDVFFPVRDFNVSTVDRASLISLRFHQNLREGHYRVMRNTLMDYENNKYEFEKIYKGKTKQESGAISGYVSDMLSSFFYTRTLPLNPGDEFSIHVFYDKEIVPLHVQVLPKVETVRVAAGKFECLHLRPLITGDAIFKAKDGRMSIWLTNDERHMPVLIRSKVAVGSFDAELIDYEPKER